VNGRSGTGARAVWRVFLIPPDPVVRRAVHALLRAKKKGGKRGAEELVPAARHIETLTASRLLTPQVLPPTDNGGTLPTTMVAVAGAPNGTMCVDVTLPTGIRAGETGGVDAFGSHVRAQTPKPSKIGKGDPQRVKLAYSHVVVSPYAVKEQTTKVRVGGCGWWILFLFSIDHTPHFLPNPFPPAHPARPRRGRLHPQAAVRRGRRHADARALHQHAAARALARVGALRQQRAVCAREWKGEREIETRSNGSRRVVL
jgi:Ribophorin I